MSTAKQLRRTAPQVSASPTFNRAVGPRNLKFVVSHGQRVARPTERPRTTEERLALVYQALPRE